MAVEMTASPAMTRKAVAVAKMDFFGDRIHGHHHTNSILIWQAGFESLIIRNS